MRLAIVVLLLTATVPASEAAGRQEKRAALDLPRLFEALLRPLRGENPQDRVLAELEANWQVSYVPMLVEALRVSSNPERYAIVELLDRKTGTGIGGDINEWFEWIWREEIEPHPRYAEVKSVLYRRIDPRFAKYFHPDRATAIPLDEVRWGGVVQDGIPPLRGPTMSTAGEAGYLGDDDVVFGVEVNGDVRAYPKRILAWHEMFTDEVGGIHVTGVY